jgi:RecB family endonuclease NucS
MFGQFSLYFHGSVRYDGRALGLLGPGNFLLLSKNDGSVSIHGGTNIPPRNYMGSGTKMHMNISAGSGTMSFKRKEEMIWIEISRIYFMEKMDDWSNDEVLLRRTEKELVHKIFTNWGDYIDGEFEIIEKEHPTEYGPVDLVGIESDRTRHVIEVKRRKASVTDATQLRKYVEAFEPACAKGYLASPEIGDNALKFLAKHGYKWLRVEFDEIPLFPSSSNPQDDP